MILTYDIDENMSRGSVNMRDSGFSLNNYVKKVKKVNIILSRRWFLTIMVILNIYFFILIVILREREYAGLAIFT